MFSQKRKNHTWIYLCLAIVIAILGILILISALSNGQAEDAESTLLHSQVETENRESQEEKDKPEEKTKEDQQKSFYQSYYLVKYDNHVIKIFFSDETGSLTELETTGIVYETLAPEDQMQFREGIKVETRENLNRLIMDYES